MPNVEAKPRDWVAAIHARYPRARWIIYAYFAVQAVWQAWNAGGYMIDAYSHAQFMAQHRQELLAGVKSIIAAIFSPAGSIVTFILGIGYLVLDSRVAKPQSEKLPPAPDDEKPTPARPV